MDSGPNWVVDSHVHFWNRELLAYPWLDDAPTLRRSFLPSDLVPEIVDLDGHVLAGVVAVEADCLTGQAAAEAAWLEGLADARTPVLGIVAHASLERGTGASDELAGYAASSLVVGVRRLLQDEPAGFSLTPDFVAGVGLLARHGLVMDLCVRHHQLREMARLVERCPQVEFVLDHVGKPALERTAHAAWAHDLATLAALPNVSCKLSGLSTEVGGRSDESTFQPWLRQALEAFGAGRCLFGSDWPLVTGGIGYARWFETVRAALSDVSDRERSQVLSTNALALYDPVSRGSRATKS